MIIFDEVKYSLLYYVNARSIYSVESLVWMDGTLLCSDVIRQVSICCYFDRTESHNRF